MIPQLLIFIENIIYHQWHSGQMLSETQITVGTHFPTGNKYIAIDLKS